MQILPKPPFTPALTYGLAVATAACAALLQWAIRPWVGTHVPFIFFLPALMFSAVTLGRGPALLVMAAGAANDALLSPPLGQFAFAHTHDRTAMLIYLGLSSLLVSYGGYLRLVTSRAALAEKRLSLAQDQTGVGVFELDFRGGTAFVSPSLCQILGQPIMTGPIALDRWLGALHPRHVEETRRAMQERIDKGELRYEREQRVVLAGGETRWLLNRVRLDVAPSGTLTQARGVAVDITARKEVDELLLNAQSQLRQRVSDLERLHALSRELVAVGDDAAPPLPALLELAADLHGARHGLVSLCDPGSPEQRLAASLGFPETVLQNLPTTADVAAAEAYAEAHHAILAAHRALGAQQGLDGVHSTLLHAGGGAVIGVMSVMFPEPYRPGEREIRLSEVCASTAAAVVERQRSRAAAKENEKRFTVTMESSLVPFCILTPVHDESRRIIDFRWTYLNPAAARALGREIPQLLGRRIGAVLPGVWDAPEMFAHYVKVVETGVPSEFEVCSVATGRGGWFNVVASPLQGSAAVWFADISERKRQQQTLEEADRRKDEFLATLAHELRNPLAPMRQAVRIAGAANSTESQKLWAHAVIERQVQHMSLLLDDLLDVSRITRGTLLLRKAAVSLTTIIDNAVEIARPALEARRHRLRLMLPQARVTLQVDPLRLSQVLGNLLINAAKYTDPEGDIRLGVELEDAALVVRVTDNGIGLSGEQLQQLFVMFSQLASGAARSQGGLGIGLALSRGLIELHGGELVASSAGPGQGSEFTVRLPSTCYSRSAAATADPAARQRPDGAGAAHRILIADDNPDAADSLAELLRLEGHTVEVAYDGAQALASFASFEPAAALLDVGMPRMSGLEVVRAIRQLPAGRDAVLIAITGWGQEIDRRNAIDAGFDHHVTKPMDPVYVQDLIARGRARVRAT